MSNPFKPGDIIFFVEDTWPDELYKEHHIKPNKRYAVTKADDGARIAIFNPGCGSSHTCPDETDNGDCGWWYSYRFILVLPPPMPLFHRFDLDME